MQCPKCKVIVLNSTTVCRCGYNFSSPESTTPKGSITRNKYKSPYSDNVSVSSTNVKKFFFQGKWLDLFAIYIINSLLTVVTLGIYYFWGKVKVKRFLYSNTEFDGDRFSFHGTGWELFRGGIIALILFIGYSVAQFYAERHQQELWAIGLSVGLTILFFLFIPFAIVLSRKYYLSRTSYKGIRFSFRGKALSFIWVLFKGSLLTLLTLGFYYPYMINQINRFFINNSYFGNKNFVYKGRGYDIFKKYILAFLLTISFYGFLIAIIGITIGFNLKDLKPDSSFPMDLAGPIIGGVAIIAIAMVLTWTWFGYWILKYIWNNVHFLNSKFSCNFKFGSYLGLIIGNFFLILISFGLLFPLVVVRNIKFLLNHLTLNGNLDIDQITQDMRDTSATGESIADFMDIGSGIDLGI